MIPRLAKCSELDNPYPQRVVEELNALADLEEALRDLGKRLARNHERLNDPSEILDLITEIHSHADTVLFCHDEVQNYCLEISKKGRHQ